MKISLIAAVAENNVIGKDNEMVWRLPDDFKRFKALTSNHFILMGRKSFESLDGLLPNRTHVVITRNKNYSMPEGHFVFHSLEEGLAFCESKNVDHLYVIGGGEIYKEALPHAHQMQLTEVNASPEGDAFFPEFDKSNWKTSFSEHHPADERHEYSFTYVDYERI
ncbi:dihydrofolate reductase [Algoriphagus ratkowskyi]|uniref:Dihydrofolate reductase n=1 Tax=Algoriphagus ratkowskyi TaxID=57028 RepID=A0A2W7QZA1_9BACT|nr:dihydrofolate reductase [Algoriphagus ratkowskyi]PZX53848.1 dihydrofolate reductase [Algoriphagus ratkowskyi]TXD76747.1 dihydrofolate reductase [Algoriphagus ratkowskyi]